MQTVRTRMGKQRPSSSTLRQMQNPLLGQRAEAEVMPEVGEIKRACEVGHKGYHLYIWAVCPDCGRERWVALCKGKPRVVLCASCAAKRLFTGKWMKGRIREQNPNWKGGHLTNKDGYIDIKLYPDDFFYPMANKRGYVREHRLVVARALSRCLLPWEIVHHKGVKYPQGSKENRGDNRYPENLELLPRQKYHLVDLVARSLIIKLQKQVTSLKAENILLKNRLSAYCPHE